ncbi:MULTISPECIES: hypothetical protein [unclassified Pseudomonas]|uniref:hypothetical protein n=1 Tax=unclassified Pseudomonas TaxID=196821 RepID=UPI000D3563FC|nr:MULTISPECIES: hypothetical protein [unclassified Pseudomonas]RAU46587.1 hypothetical protein DBP26_010495 [Pseudomonas sp. RIT 409]RAU52400.1 hypothetical protein DBY65_017355 [Pseudomonas sp. RIT 412]
MWGSKELWDWLNQFGVICTILGTVLTCITFLYVKKVRGLLISKSRIPAVSIDLAKLLPEFREGLRDWDNSKEDVIHKLYEIKGHIENIRPSLGVKERPLADKLIELMNFDNGFFSRPREPTLKEGWRISRHMVQFEVMLSGLDKDNEAARI